MRPRQELAIKRLAVQAMIFVLLAPPALADESSHPSWVTYDDDKSATQAAPPGKDAGATSASPANSAGPAQDASNSMPAGSSSSAGKEQAPGGSSSGAGKEQAPGMKGALSESVVVPAGGKASPPV